MAKSNYLEEKVLGAVFDGSTFTAVSKVYVALFETDPAETGSGTELSGGSYARVETTPGSDWTGSGGQRTNANDIEFPTSTGAQGTANYVALFDAATNGNMLYSAELSPARDVDSAGIKIVIPAGDLVVTED